MYNAVDGGLIEFNLGDGDDNIAEPVEPSVDGVVETSCSEPEEEIREITYDEDPKDVAEEKPKDDDDDDDKKKKKKKSTTEKRKRKTSEKPEKAEKKKKSAPKKRAKKETDEPKKTEKAEKKKPAESGKIVNTKILTKMLTEKIGRAPSDDVVEKAATEIESKVASHLLMAQMAAGKSKLHAKDIVVHAIGAALNA